MRQRVREGRLAAALAGAALVALAAAPAAAFEVKKVDDGVVRIVVFEVKNGRRTGTTYSGTGFVVDDEYVLTNEHVVDDSDFTKSGAAAEHVVVDGSRQNLRKAKVVWSSPELDLAVVRVPGLRRPTLALSSLPPADYPPKGAAVWAIGFPSIADRSIQSEEAFVNSTLTQGVVSKVVQGRASARDKMRPVIQHNASINKGNSGGPLFDNCGLVVGVNTFGALSTMEVQRDQRGREIAAGMANTGVFYSPHIASFLAAQKTVAALKPLKLRLSAAPCVAAAAAPAGPAGLPVWVYGVIGLVSLLALTSTVAAFRKGTTREIVRVVESYSAYLRRQGAPPSLLNRRKAARGKTAGADGMSRTAPPAPAAASGPGDWVLAGRSKEKSFRVEISADELARAARGSEGGLVIGRSRSLTDKAIDDPSISRRHAKLFLADGALMIEDMGSAFGTKVNGKPVGAGQAAALASGDVLAIGGATLTLERVG
jgi:hypothetical protein